MSVLSKNIQKSNKRGPYNKISKQLKAEILSQLQQFNNIDEISKNYGIARSTLYSYLKPKEHIYFKFTNNVTNKIHQYIDDYISRLQNLSDFAFKKNIKYIIKTLEYFEYSERNSLRESLPETKINSKKDRIIQKILNDAFQYFNNKKQLMDTPNTGQVVSFNQEEQIDSLLQLNQEIISQSEIQKVTNLNETQYLSDHSNAELFEYNPIFLEYSNDYEIV